MWTQNLLVGPVPSDRRPSPLILCFTLAGVLLGVDASAQPAVAQERPTPSSSPWASAPVGALVSPAGAPLALERLEVEVTVMGRLARTEVTHVFRSGADVVTEGTFSFALPWGAQIGRLAMDVEGKLMEGELVEREKARQIYEQIVRGQKDPALLEWQGQNRFSTQIFPIPPRGTKTVVLGYDEVLPVSGRDVVYRYALPALAGAQANERAPGSVGQFRFRLAAPGKTLPALPADMEQAAGLSPARMDGVISLEGRQFTPRGPLVVPLGPAGATSTLVGSLGEERFFHVDWVPDVDPGRLPPLGGLVVAIDTSAGLGDVAVRRAGQMVAALLEELPAGTPVKVLTGDVAVRTACPLLRGVGRPPGSPLGGASVPDCLKRLDAGGATDLLALLEAALVEAKRMGKGKGKGSRGAAAAVVITDGAASLGELDADLIRARVLESGRGVALHAVAAGPSPDEDFLAGLTRALGGHTLRMLPDEAPASTAEALAHRVRVPLVTDVTVAVVEGQAVGITPTPLDNALARRPLAVFGRLKSGAATLRFRGQVAGRTVEEAVTVTAAPDEGVGRLLARFWARGQLRGMEEAKMGRDEVVSLSIRYGVMSRYTSFLVLENEEAYQRFAIARKKDAERVADQERAAQKNLTKSEEDLKDVLARNEAKPAAPAPSPPPPPPPGAAEESKSEARGGFEGEMDAEAESFDDEAPRERASSMAGAKAKKSVAAKPGRRRVEELITADPAFAALPTSRKAYTLQRLLAVSRTADADRLFARHLRGQPLTVPEIVDLYTQRLAARYFDDLLAHAKPHLDQGAHDDLIALIARTALANKKGARGPHPRGSVCAEGGADLRRLAGAARRGVA